jgi:hypothetical protein
MNKIITAVFMMVSCLIGMAAYTLYAAEERAWVKSILASSVLEPEKGTFDQGNLMDLTDDSWCEGKKDAGIGESITISLASPVPMKTLYIKNGLGDPKYWSANNRVRDIAINGRTYTLKDIQGFQSVSLPGKASDTLVLTIQSVYRGEKWNDTCIAEVGFADPGAALNRRDSYGKIVGKGWESAGGMPGGVTTFSRGFLFQGDVVPCGDETCPDSSVGSCRPLAGDRYECRYVEHCRGTYDPRLNRSGRVCTPMDDMFVLEISGGVPAVTINGKKQKLAPFN